MSPRKDDSVAFWLLVILFIVALIILLHVFGLCV